MSIKQQGRLDQEATGKVAQEEREREITERKTRGKNPKKGGD